jgi:hypothetical protein
VILRMGEQYLTLYFPGDERTGQSAPGAAVPGVGTPGAASGTQGLRDIKTLLPPSLTGRAAPAPPVSTAPPPPAPPAANATGGNNLISSLGATVTPQGYQLGASLSPQMQAAGLAPGDVVASVNGISAASLAGDPGRLAQTMASGNARLEVVRGGNRISVSVPTR